MHLGQLRAAHGDGDRVSARVARIRLQRRRIVVLCHRVVVMPGYRRVMVFMRGWAVVVLRMIVPEVLVHVLNRPHGGRNDKGLNQRACDKATHGEQSTMTATGAGTPSHLDALAGSSSALDTTFLIL